MAKDELWRLRLKHEDSLQRCALCGCRGIVGEDIKRYLSEDQDSSHPLFRCADRKSCVKRTETSE